MLVALGLVGVSVLGITILVTDLLFSYSLAVIVATAYVITVTVLWLALPMHSIRRARAGR